MKTLKLTTRELFDSAAASALDMAWDDRTFDGCKHLLDLVVSGDINDIRKAFKVGYTMMLTGGIQKNGGNVFCQIEDAVLNNEEVEIRIYDESQTLLGVIIHNEISY